MRLFVGIALAGAVVRELESVVTPLRASGPSSGSGLRWTDPDSWHVTLQFLGNTTAEQYDCLMARLSEVRCEPVRVHLASLGCFERAGVFFVDVAATSGLAALAKRVSAATAGCGFAAETRPFHPHITLARAKGPGRGAETRALTSRIRRKPAFTPVTAREFLLYESRLGGERARYEVRGRFLLIGPTSDV